MPKSNSPTVSPPAFRSQWLGILGLLLAIEFWAHLLIPWMRNNVTSPFWPTGAVLQLVLGGLIASVAAVRGSRLWWVVVAAAAIGLVAIVYMVQG